MGISMGMWPALDAWSARNCGAVRARNGGGIYLSKNRPGLNARSGGRKTQALYNKGVCCGILHKKTRQEEGVGSLGATST